MAEHRTVDARVVGSTPISHPTKIGLNARFFLTLFPKDLNKESVNYGGMSAIFEKGMLYNYINAESFVTVIV